MPTVETVTNRLACNVLSRVGTLDVLSGDQVRLYQGVSAVFQCALFNGTPSSTTYVTSVTNIEQIELYIRRSGPNGGVLLHKEYVTLRASSFAAWNAGVEEQFTFELTEADTSQNVPTDGTQKIYFTIIVTATDAQDSLTTYVAAFGYGEIVSVGLLDLAAPPDSPYVALYHGNDGKVGNPYLDFSNVFLTGISVVGLTFDEFTINAKPFPTSKTFFSIDMSDTAGGSNWSTVANFTTANMYGFRVRLAGGSAGTGKTLVGGDFYTIIEETAPGTNTGDDTLRVTADSAATNITIGRHRALVVSTLLDGVATTSFGITNRMQTVGTLANYNSCVCQYNDIFIASGSATDPVLFKGQIRASGIGNLPGSAKGISLDTWSIGTGTAPTTSYGIYIDSTIGIGTTKWTFYSLCTAPSLYSGTLSATSLITPPTGFAVGTPVEGTICAFNNANTGTPGATITTTGLFHVLGYYNGSAWIVL